MEGKIQENSLEDKKELGKKVLSALYTYNKINLAEYGWVIRRHPEYLFKLSGFAKEDIESVDIERAYKIIKDLLKDNLY